MTHIKTYVLYIQRDMLQQLIQYDKDEERRTASQQMIPPEKILEQIGQFNDSLNVLLSQYQKIYVLSKMQPTNEEYQLTFDRLTDQIQQIQSRVRSTQTSIQTLVDELNGEMLTLNEAIQREKERNADLRRQLGMVNSHSNAANEMVDDYQYINKTRYIRNWSLGLSVLACFYMIYKNTRPMTATALST